MNNFTVADIFVNLCKGIMKIISPLIIILVAGIFLYSFFSACSVKFLSKENENANFGKLLLGGFSKALSMFIEKLPALVMLGLVVTGISMASQFFNQFKTIWEQNKRIKELNSYVQNLSNSEDIAIITLKERFFVSNKTYSTYQVQVIDNITGEVITDEDLRLSGKELKLDSMVINFDYSDIESGKSKNIAFPYKVFSENLAPDNGIKLKTIFSITDSENIDDILELESNSAYGLTKEAFINRAKEFIEIVKDPVKSREMGIKSSYGETITIPQTAKPGDTFYVRITGVGGLTLIAQQ